MELKDYIFKRKSTRSYMAKIIEPDVLADITEYISNLKPLYPDIKVKAEIVGKKDVKSIMTWLPPQILAIYSEEKEGMFENIGFMFQQLDLYLHSIGLGCCWVGLGKADTSVPADETSLKFVILLAFGYPKNSDFRSNPSDFKRKSLTEISNDSSACLEPARLAPSAVNSQPWYFVSDNGIFHTYRNKRGILSKFRKTMNLIDMGIALAHMYVANTESFDFFKTDSYPEQKGMEYIGSFKI
ncbi:MAG: nitroreductase [Clostridia bacterium]|nr:nitroreductase [Clostridia bacterium]